MFSVRCAEKTVSERTAAKRKRSTSPEPPTRSALAPLDPNNKRAKTDQNDSENLMETPAPTSTDPFAYPFDHPHLTLGRVEGEKNFFYAPDVDGQISSQWASLLVPRIVTVGFSQDGVQFALYSRLLVKYFRYFRAGLRHSRSGTGPVWLEGRTKHFQLEETSAEGMSRVLAYLERLLRSKKPHLTNILQEPKYEAEPIWILLQAMITADYLALVKFDNFESYMSQLFAVSVMMDRSQVTPAVIVLISDHPAFRSGMFMDVCARAAVRVVMRPHLWREGPYYNAQNIYPIHTKRPHEAEHHVMSKQVSHFRAKEYEPGPFWEDVSVQYQEMMDAFPVFAHYARVAVEMVKDNRYAAAHRSSFYAFDTCCVDPLHWYTMIVQISAPCHFFFPLPETCFEEWVQGVNGTWYRDQSTRYHPGPLLADLKPTKVLDRS